MIPVLKSLVPLLCRVVAAFTAVLLLAATFVAAGVDATPARAVPPFPIQDPTDGPSGKLDPHWEYARSGTGNVGNTYTSDGWLRLTNAKTDQATNILNSTPFPSSAGFEVTFDYRMAGGTKNPWDDRVRGGDGLAMYLIDGSTPISVGAPGSGLGYAQGLEGGTQLCGVRGGYLGLGLDEFGNFANKYGNANAGPTDMQGIGLRGSGDGCQTPVSSRYPWVAGSPVDLATASYGDTRDPASYASKFRRATIRVVPSGNNVQVTVWLSPLTNSGATPGAMTQMFSSSLSNVSGQVPLPSTLKVGFSASTGQATDYHDIRWVKVKALSDIAVTKTVTSTSHTGYPANTYLPGDQVSFTLTATNNGPSAIGSTESGGGPVRVFDDLSSLPMSNVSWTCARASGDATCLNASGTGSVVSADWKGSAGSSVKVVVTGTVTGGDGSFTNTAIVPTDLVNNKLDLNSNDVQLGGGLSDTNLGNNTASASFAVAVPSKPGLSITKQAALSPGATGKAGDTVRYTFTAKNTGDVTLTGVQIADPLDGLSPILFGDWPAEPGTLQPGQTVVATASYTVTAADLARGSVENTAWATGTGPKGQQVRGGSNTVTIPLLPEPAVLAHTGSDLVPMGAGAAALLAAGLLLLGLRRRKRTA